MKKLLVLPLLGALVGCINPAPINSCIMVDEVITGADHFDNSVKMVKCGRAKAKHIILVGVGDASIKAAMADGGVEKIHHVDHKSMNVLGLYMENETIVWGE